MKTKEKLSRLRQSKSWTERMLLARDRLPGTPFDTEIQCLVECLKQIEEMRDRGTAQPCFRETYVHDKGLDLEGLNSHSLQSFGEQMTRAMIEGDSGLFREWAKAIDTWHAHKPHPDKLRAAVIRYCIPPNETFSMRSIIAHLCELGLAEKGLKSREYDGLRTQVQRVAKDAKIRIKGQAGRPSSN